MAQTNPARSSKPQRGSACANARPEYGPDLGSREPLECGAALYHDWEFKTMLRTELLEAREERTLDLVWRGNKMMTRSQQRNRLDYQRPTAPKSVKSASSSVHRERLCQGSVLASRPIRSWKASAATKLLVEQDMRILALASWPGQVDYDVW